MKGNAEAISALNEALAEELTAINQYFLHAEMCEAWGYHKLAGMIKKESIDEMKHAESIMERILFLEGRPSMNKVQMDIGQNVPDLLNNDLKLESGAVQLYNRLIQAVIKADDHGTAELLKQILKDEERHVDEIETQLDLIRELGLPNYLTIQV
jgi:bacterioferritin